MRQTGWATNGRPISFVVRRMKRKPNGDLPAVPRTYRVLGVRASGECVVIAQRLTITKARQLIPYLSSQFERVEIETDPPGNRRQRTA